jgi:hypothetical protein
MYFSVKAHSVEPGATLVAPASPCWHRFDLASPRGNRHALARRWVR